MKMVGVKYRSLYVSVLLLQTFNNVLIKRYAFTTGRGYLDDVTLMSAKLGPGTPAVWVEKCSCPASYDGLFCERCATGYKRRFPGQGPQSPCDPCSCQGGTCDPETGILSVFYFLSFI